MCRQVSTLHQRSLDHSIPELAQFDLHIKRITYQCIFFSNVLRVAFNNALLKGSIDHTSFT